MDVATQQTVAFIFGVIFVSVILILAIFFKDPTPFQYNVFRTVLALAGGGAAALIPGFLSVEINPSDVILVRAGGAMAAFVLLYFFNPAKLVIPKEAPARNEARINSPGDNINNTNSNMTLINFINNQGSVAEQNDYFRNDIGFTKSLNSQYMTDQFNAYKEVWRSLQALRYLGDDLWEAATEENVATFAAQLRETLHLITQQALCFEEHDYARLENILEEFGRFRIGKIRLIEIRSKDELRRYGDMDDVEIQIQKNHEIKLKYEHLLDEIRVSFRKKLNMLAKTTT